MARILCTNPLSDLIFLTLLQMSAASQGSQKWVSRWASLADSYSDSGSVSGQGDGTAGKSHPTLPFGGGWIKTRMTEKAEIKGICASGCSFSVLATVVGDGKHRVNCSQWAEDGESLWFAFWSYSRGS